MLVLPPPLLDLAGLLGAVGLVCALFLLVMAVAALLTRRRPGRWAWPWLLGWAFALTGIVSHNPFGVLFGEGLWVAAFVAYIRAGRGVPVTPQAQSAAFRRAAALRVAFGSACLVAGFWILSQPASADLWPTGRVLGTAGLATLLLGFVRPLVRLLGLRGYCDLRIVALLTCTVVYWRAVLTESLPPGEGRQPQILLGLVLTATVARTFWQVLQLRRMAVEVEARGRRM